jgi:hypothetical protein
MALQTLEFLTGAAIFYPHDDPADHFTMDNQYLLRMIQLRGQVFLDEMLKLKMSRKASAFLEPNGENPGLASQISVLTPVVECRFPYQAKIIPRYSNPSEITRLLISWNSVWYSCLSSSVVEY